MKRLPMTGASLASGGLTVTDLKTALIRLGAAETFADAEGEQLYFRISQISGAWLAKEESKEATSVVSALRQAANNLAKTSELLSGYEEGMKSTVEIFATRLVYQQLALNLTPDPREFISRFREDVKKVGQACMEASVDLSAKSTINGRDALLWHDDFTNMLLTIAKQAGVEPTLGNDPIKGVPCGWLFDAATELERFLYKDMRTITPAARGKRLETSLKRLGIQ